jgi:hypothetical protein
VDHVLKRRENVQKSGLFLPILNGDSRMPAKIIQNPDKMVLYSGHDTKIGQFDFRTLSDLNTGLLVCFSDVHCILTELALSQFNL